MKYKLPAKDFLNILLTVFVLFLGFYTLPAQIQKLKVGDNHRFIVKEDNTPFVWVGGTNWFFAKLPPATIDSILDKRADQGFTILFVSAREQMYNGTKTGSIDQPNEAWWSYLDEYIAKCEQRNLYVGITLGWWGKTRNSSEEELYEYGKWVGHRYRHNNNIVWLTLGEAGGHLRKTTIPENKLQALVRGIRDGDTGNKLLTIHADFKRGTSLSKDGAICDFNNWQTSQWCCIDDLPRKDDRNWTVWEAIAFDYNKQYSGKPKPTLDSEAWYENNKDFCGATAYNIRRRAYFTIFAGAFGHTYGGGGIWDGLSTADSCSSAALRAIHYEGAEQIGYLSSFLHRLGNDFLKLRPDQAFISGPNSSNYDQHIQATMAQDRSFALVYSASDAPYKINLNRLKASRPHLLWFNPRTNEYEAAELSPVREKKTLLVDPPSSLGPGNDGVLLIGNPKFINTQQ